ncbi:MAG TPA: pyridoxal phosphate-dependent aminotransferase [Candidatus Pseudogracilibacillus intestinigallinarum]|uniref:Aminotransferase n=1 Tax=Candidatus Pseudogracilibacillus intestinigallinarum TaxID=2838742 RepID=A0A9D1TL90_9BACI|nr:pyridoxal phosphate-dependent aminotransferase [Candidatus Pseudogracilibacillus intestinigallinarum]
MELSKRVQSLSGSPTLAISAKAKQLKDEGHDVIGLGVGEPDFNTPTYIMDAAKKAMDEGMTKYTPAGGIPALKTAIVEKLQTDHHLTYETNQVIVTTGAKYALYALFQVVLNEGDEVIIPTPYWVSYPEHVQLAGGKPVFVEGLESKDFKITKEQLEAVITPKTKAVIINSPSNPTGMMYSKEELATIAEVCIKHNILIVSDEIYERLIYAKEPHVSIAEISNAAKEQTVIINGVSKSHAMTGWRIGYAVGPDNIIKAMTNHASHATSNPTSIAQYAALEAYTNQTEDEKIANEMRQTFHERLDRLYELMNDIPGFSCAKPKGAFYIFPNVIEAVKMNGFHDVNEWAKALLEEEKVAVVPGIGFGAPNNIRLSYATSLELLEEAAKRIKRFVIEYQK